MPAVTVVVGPPCAGKSTWIAEQRKSGDVVVDFDQLAQALGSDTPHAAPEPVREVAFAARRSAVTRVLQGVDADAWIIHTTPRPEQLDSYREAGADVVVIDPGLETCLARAAADARPDGTDAAIRAWYDNPPTEKGRRRMRTKECTARVKAAGPDDGLQPGQFTALVSVFGNEDSMGDVVAPGAFGQVLAEWRAKGDPIPVVWSHKWADPFSHIGTVLEASETADGLVVTGQVEDLDTNPTAAQVYRLLKGRRVTQFSFAYEVAEGGWVETDDTTAHPWGEYYEIKRFGSLFEVGPCLVGANQETELLAAKAADLTRGLKEGRVLAGAHYDRLVSAHQAIGEVLAAAEPQKTSRPSGRVTTQQETGQQPEPGTATATAAATSPAHTPAQVTAWTTTRHMTMRRTA